MTSSEDAPGHTVRGAPFIAAERVSNVRAWVLPDLLPPPPPKPEPVLEAQPEAPRLPTAREIEEMEAAAWAEGHARGLEEGRNTGYETGLEQAREQARKLVSMLDHLAAPLAEVEQTLESEVLQLCTDLAERLLRRQLEMAPEMVQTVVREALDALGRTGSEIRVHANPADVAVLELLEVRPGAQGWTLIADGAIERGGCRVITDYGQVDATLATRITELRRELFGVRA